MITLAINWGYALLVTGVGMLTVFLLLILLIWVINLQTKLTNQVDHAKTIEDVEKLAFGKNDYHFILCPSYY